MLLINRMDYDVTTNPIGGQPYERADHHHENRPRTQGPGHKVLGELGLSLSGAVTIFLKAVVREQGLPIDMSIRSDKTDESNR